MILTDLLGSRVTGEDGGRLGWVTDVRLLLDEVSTDQATPPARLYGLVVSPHTRWSSMGFDRSQVRSPRLVAVPERWLHRGTFVVHWPDVAAVGPGQVRLRTGFRPYAALLPTNAARSHAVHPTSSQ